MNKIPIQNEPKISRNGEKGLLSVIDIGVSCYLSNMGFSLDQASEYNKRNLNNMFYGEFIEMIKFIDIRFSHNVPHLRSALHDVVDAMRDKFVIINKG